MKTIARLFAYSAIISLTLIACAPDEVTPAEEENGCEIAVTPITSLAEIEGTWNWCMTIQVDQVTGIDSISPETTGVQMSVEITSSQEAIVYHGSTRVASYPFSLREVVNSDDLLFEVLNPSDAFSPNVEMAGLARVDGDVLSIIGSYNDGGDNQTFNRVVE